MKVFWNKKVHDFPKRSGDACLAWYNQGQVCILRKRPIFNWKAQHLKIKEINLICLTLWSEQSDGFKRDMKKYAKLFKTTYPGLRKRGVSAYSIFLILIHALIKRFSLNDISSDLLRSVLRKLLDSLSVFKAIQIRLLKRVPNAYRLNYKSQNKEDGKNFAISDTQYPKKQTENGNDHEPIDRLYVRLTPG